MLTSKSQQKPKQRLQIPPNIHLKPNYQNTLSIKNSNTHSTPQNIQKLQNTSPAYSSKQFKKGNESSQMLIEDNYNDIIKWNIQNIKKASSNLQTLKSAKQENIARIVQKIAKDKNNVFSTKPSQRSIQTLQTKAQDFRGMIQNQSVNNRYGLDQKDDLIKIQINISKNNNTSDSVLQEIYLQSDMHPALQDQDLAPIQDNSQSDRNLLNLQDHRQNIQRLMNPQVNSTKAQSKLLESNPYIYRSVNKLDTLQDSQNCYQMNLNDTSPSQLQRFQEFSCLKQSSSNGTLNSLPMIKQPNSIAKDQLKPSIRSLVAGKSDEINKNKEFLRKRHKQNKEFFKRIQSTKGFTKFIPINQINAKPFQNINCKLDLAETTLTSMNDQISNYDIQEPTIIVSKISNMASQKNLFDSVKSKDSKSRNCFLPQINCNSTDQVLRNQKGKTKKRVENKRYDQIFGDEPKMIQRKSSKKKDQDYFAQDFKDELQEDENYFQSEFMDIKELFKVKPKNEVKSTSPKIIIQKNRVDRVMDASKMTNQRKDSSEPVTDSKISYMKDTQGCINVVGFTTPSDNKFKRVIEAQDTHSQMGSTFQQYVNKESTKQSVKSSNIVSQQLTPRQQLAKSLSHERYKKMKRVKQQIFGNDTRYGWRNSPDSSISNAYSLQDVGVKKTILKKVQSPSIKVKPQVPDSSQKFRINTDIDNVIY